jgi:hypothetical protein
MTDRTEAFQSTPLSTKPVIKDTIPSTPYPSSIPVKGNIDRSFNPDTVQPYSMPGELPVAGYEQIGAMSPLPYQDTALIKANRQQLVSLLEMIKGFLAFEAQEISEKSDPSIQLPLQTARSDFHVLQREVDVQNRNPGVQSTLTLTNINEMSSNLAYLQQKVRLTGANGIGALQGPINEFGAEGFQTQSNVAKGPIATKKDLQEFVGKIQGEILRLSASGTNDPIMVARVKGLTDMKTSIQQLIDQLTTGIIKESEVPVLKSDIQNALPILGKPNEPLPQVIKTLGLPAGLANALPSSLKKDPQTMQQISSLVNKYADQIVNGISFEVKYSPVQAQQVQQQQAAQQQQAVQQRGSDASIPMASRFIPSTIDQTGFPSMADIENVSNAKFIPMDQGALTDRLAAQPMDAGRGPSHFDWKERATQIQNQIVQRGLNPTDYGITPTSKASDRSKDFSWKGYTKMICTRLQATMDPALPVTCGCPPMDWQGWRDK